MGYLHDIGSGYPLVFRSSSADILQHIDGTVSAKFHPFLYAGQFGEIVDIVEQREQNGNRQSKFNEDCPFVAEYEF
jgi:hypothetical protein